MKKALWLLLLTLLCCAFGVSAAADVPDLVFTPDTSGRYIYCNNHEFIRRQDLSDGSNKDATYIMNNDNMGAGKYAMFVSHVNHTELVDENGTMIGPGFDVEVDVQFVAKQDTTLTITALGFEVPENRKYYTNGTGYTYEEAWGCMNAWSTYKQIPLYEIDSGQKYYPAPFAPITISMKKGEVLWLSRYIENYRAVPFYRPVHLLADFEITSGSADVNIAALKSNGTLRDRSHHSPRAKRGTYQRDTQYKGVADALNSVSTELNFTVDDSTWSGSMLPVKVYNQYVPEGNEVTQWTTHINPQADIWARAAGTESDMLAFHYNDGTKEQYYGGSVPPEERDPVWHFDTFHSDFQQYPGRDSGFTAARYQPNFKLPEGNQQEGLGPCNLGNYGVSVNYKINVNNRGDRTRYVNYRLATSSNNIIILRDGQGNLVNPYGLCKGYHELKERDVMASVELPPRKTTTFYLEVILPTNYVGGMENTLELNDMPTPIQFYDSPRQPVDVPYCNTGKEYVKWENGGLYRSEDLEHWEEIPLNNATKAIFAGTWEEVQLLYTGSGYMAKPTLYDGIPYYGAQEYFRKVYFLDETFQLVGSHEFSGYPARMSYAKGNYYAQVWNTPYRSADGTHWELFSGPIPIDNGGPYALAADGGQLAVSADGNTYWPILFEGSAPAFAETAAGWYYSMEGNTLLVSKDGIYWTELDAGQPVQSVAFVPDKAVVNEVISLPLPGQQPQITLRLKEQILAFDTPPVQESGRTLVPARMLFEQAGAVVEWEEQTQTADIRLGENHIQLMANGDAALVNGREVAMDVPPRLCNGRLLVPVRFVAEALGYQVEWDEALAMVVLK